MQSTASVIDKNWKDLIKPNKLEIISNECMYSELVTYLRYQAISVQLNPKKCFLILYFRLVKLYQYH